MTNSGLNEVLKSHGGVDVNGGIGGGDDDGGGSACC